MSTKYKIRDQTPALPAGRKLHFITFAVVEWVDVFTRRMYKNAHPWFVSPPKKGRAGFTKQVKHKK